MRGSNLPRLIPLTECYPRRGRSRLSFSQTAKRSLRRLYWTPSGAHFDIFVLLWLNSGYLSVLEEAGVIRAPEGGFQVGEFVNASVAKLT